MNQSSRFPLPRCGWVIAALALALASCSRPAPVAPPPVDQGVVVVAVDAIARTVPLTIDAVGHVDAGATFTLTPLVSARIAALPVADGSEVKAGDVLIRFDPRSYEAQLARMKGEQAARQAQVDALQSRSQRSHDLIAGDFIAPQEAQEQQVELAGAQAALAAAAAGVEQASVDLENCEPKAPFDGRIGLIRSAAAVGNFVAAGSDPLLELRSLDQLKVEFTVPESALPVLQQMAAGEKNLKVLVSQHGDKAHSLEGPVAAFDNVVDPRSRSLKVRAVVANPGHRFWPGQFVDVQMVLGSAEDAVLIPFQAVNTGPSGSYVYVVDNGKAMIKPVVLGAQIDDLVVVTSGVSGGQKVIVSGQLGLQDGSPVQVSTAAEASP
jgi:membrane fusion protein, multidrug efflux system